MIRGGNTAYLRFPNRRFTVISYENNFAAMLFIYMSFRFYGTIKLPLLQNDYVMIPLLKGSFYNYAAQSRGP